jgi:hypothetical protein
MLFKDAGRVVGGGSSIYSASSCCTVEISAQEHAQPLEQEHKHIGHQQVTISIM